MLKKILLLSTITFLLSCNFKTTDEKFIGKWVYYRTIPYGKEDHTQDGLVSSLTKEENTSETYSFQLYTGHTVLFSKQDDSTLTAVGNDMKVIYINSTGHIALVINPTNGIEFSKLK